MRHRATVVLLAVLGACGSPDAPDGGASDAGPVEADAGPDASTTDGGRDGGDLADAPDGGGDTGSPDAGGPPASLAAFWEQYASDNCAVLARCSDGVVLAECIEELRARATDGYVPLYRDLLASGSAAFDPAAAAACLDALRTTDCASYWASMIFMCGAEVVGRIADGDACAVDAECAPTSFCDDLAGCGNMGVCIRRPAVGESCSVTGAPCPHPANCDGTLCVLPDLPTAGDPCTLFCGGPGLECWDGTCRDFEDAMRGGIGAACDLFSSPRRCSSGLVCTSSGSGSTCQPGGIALGAACEEAIPSPCAGDAYCDATRRECAPLPVEDENCDATRECAGPLVCRCPTDAPCTTGRICMAMRRLGESCVDAAACYSSNCIGGVCVEARLCD